MTARILYFCMITLHYILSISFPQITQLKIDNNPFAKGFRDNGMGRRYVTLKIFEKIVSVIT